jgi:hypothetical protein
MTNALAYYAKAWMTEVKSLKVQTAHHWVKIDKFVPVLNTAEQKRDKREKERKREREKERKRERENKDLIKCFVKSWKLWLIGSAI